MVYSNNRQKSAKNLVIFDSLTNYNHQLLNSIFGTLSFSYHRRQSMIGLLMNCFYFINSETITVQSLYLPEAEVTR